uniref:Uncharacterized protein n=1 Tax=Lepeophtheirus salmonis TaxID=72036 RepID=A0A0K2U229_LEPSM
MSIVPLSLTARGFTTIVKDGTAVSFISLDTNPHQYRHFKRKNRQFPPPLFKKRLVNFLKKKRKRIYTLSNSKGLKTYAKTMWVGIRLYPISCQVLVTISDLMSKTKEEFLKKFYQ